MWRCPRIRVPLALVLVWVLLPAGCASLRGYREPPRVSLVSIRPLDMTLLEQRYALQVRVLNPNDVALPLAGMDYRIEINRREFAYGVSHQSVAIPAHGEALLDVTVTSTLLDLLRQVQAAGRDTQPALSYRISGRLDLAHGPHRIPFEYSGSLSWLNGGENTR
jgi:LEA14-like dessication related protein